MENWFYSKLFQVDNQAPDSHFAFQGSLHWMRALAILCEDSLLNNSKMQNYYSKVKRANPYVEEYDIFAFENLLLSVHNYVAIRQMANINNKSTIIRSSIVAWYYTIYYASKSMISARSGNDAETHAKVAKEWHSDILLANLVMEPFDYKLESIVPNDVETAIESYRGGNRYDLNNYPRNKEEAIGAILSYLKGTAKYEREKAEEAIKKRDFKKLGVNDFRTKVAREFRDAQLSKKKINFINQTFRYRGKANYRDAICLTFKDNQFSDHTIEEFAQDIELVAKKYLLMAINYVSKRVKESNWVDFKDDVENSNRIEFEFSQLT